MFSAYHGLNTDAQTAIASEPAVFVFNERLVQGTVKSPSRYFSFTYDTM